MNNTHEWAKEQNFEYVNYYCAQAYPGSELYEGDECWESYDQLGKDFRPMATKYITSGKVLEFRDWAFPDYFKREEYLRKIYGKFGGWAVDNIHTMLDWNPRG